jgi:NAD-dependent dihydropyrimidine dehydrogenase PreA subunit
MSKNTTTKNVTTRKNEKNEKKVKTTDEPVINSVELEIVKEAINYKGILGYGLIQFGEATVECDAKGHAKGSLVWKGNRPIKAYVTPNELSYDIKEIDMKTEFTIEHMKGGVYKVLSKKGEPNPYSGGSWRVRFFKPVNNSIPVVDYISITKPKKANEEVKAKNPVTKKNATKNAISDTNNAVKTKTCSENGTKGDSSGVEKSSCKMTEILVKFAEKIDEDFNLMSVCDVNVRKYAEDYILKELKGNKFDVEKACAEFGDFLDTEVDDKVKDKNKNKFDKDIDEKELYHVFFRTGTTRTRVKHSNMDDLYEDIVLVKTFAMLEEAHKWVLQHGSKVVENQEDNYSKPIVLCIVKYDNDGLFSPGEQPHHLNTISQLCHPTYVFSEQGYEMVMGELEYDGIENHEHVVYKKKEKEVKKNEKKKVAKVNVNTKVAKSVTLPVKKDVLEKVVKKVIEKKVVDKKVIEKSVKDVKKIESKKGKSKNNTNATTVISLKGKKDEWGSELEKCPDDVIYIGRKINRGGWNLKASEFCNPYVENKSEPRNELISKYREYITTKLTDEPSLKDKLLTYKGKRLACWCAPETCHGDVLCELITKIENGDFEKKIETVDSEKEEPKSKAPAKGKGEGRKGRVSQTCRVKPNSSRSRKALPPTKKAGKPVVKKVNKPQISEEEFKQWFENGSSEYKVADIREILKGLEIPGITGNITKKAMKDIATKYVVEGEDSQ